ncbi:glycosyl hydrolase, partial [Maribellus maritimus]|uniref:glycosyl hydrolase n=1 Tax=Maribellus maritimus TaxID=2870838 RepID=UPI001EECE1B8
KIYHPETWFHFIGGNVAKEGITADLEAIAGAGISGIQLFHGQFGGPWPGVDEQIACLSPNWDDAVKFTAEECKRLGLRFTMQNCPGWAMSGGPWIKPENAMRHLVYSRTDVSGVVDTTLLVPQPSDEEWRDYQEVAVLAFPTPQGDTGKKLIPQNVTGENGVPWKDFFSGKIEKLNLSPVAEGQSHWVELSFPGSETLRTIQFSPVRGFNPNWAYEPGIKIQVQAVLSENKTKDILNIEMPPSNWQDYKPISLACSEVENVQTYRINIQNQHEMTLTGMDFLSAARKNNWEAEAGWTLRGFVRGSEHPGQSAEAFIEPSKIQDISEKMNKSGHLKWNAPAGKWTILRIGHVNTGKKNAPAPPEGTGWECNKLSEIGPDSHFAGYIGRIANGPLAGGLLNGMLLDSWECETQTWTKNMESDFDSISGYALRKWLPAVFGYVINAQETTSDFLLDWRSTIGDLFANKFYGRMADLGKQNGLTVAYETAAGDIFPADIMEYYKYADVPMCEYWQPLSDNFVGSSNFKPIKPTVSAARLYGKPRVAAEAFTSFELTWDEHLSMLKEIANIKAVDGVTHQVFHTYTHNPRTDFLPPGTSFGSSIGTPFLRGQTWWKHMPEFVNYLSRCNYLLERGKPVSDVLWYLGDEISHKPNQNAPFPEGFKYDYCNPDILLNRLSVEDGKLVTPEGLSYRLLWLPYNEQMLPETLEKIYEFVQKGATIVGNAPQSLATLKDKENAQKRFDDAVQKIWGDNVNTAGERQVGKGRVVSGMTIFEAVEKLKLEPDVTGGNALWLHRSVKRADWYFVCSPAGKAFKGDLSFNTSGTPELWDPLTGEITPLGTREENNRSVVSLDLAQAGSCFIVFRHDIEKKEKKKASHEQQATVLAELNKDWQLSFPAGWGAPENIQMDSLEAWKDLGISPEGKAFSGSATYSV